MGCLVVVATPAPLPASFDRGRWPAHVTIVGNFWLGSDLLGSVTSAVTEASSREGAFGVPLGPLATFGPGGDIAVLLAEDPAFHRLHRSVVDAISGLPGVRRVHPEYWGDGYRPHATLSSTGDRRAGSLLHITDLAVVSLDGSTARVEAGVRLGTGPSPCR